MSARSNWFFSSLRAVLRDTAIGFGAAAALAAAIAGFLAAL